MITNYISLTNEPCIFSVRKSSIDKNAYDLRFDSNDAILVIEVRENFLKKINNALRSVCYPMHSEERVKVCLKGTVAKSTLSASSDLTSTATMASFLKSLRVEDLVLDGMNGFAESSSAQAEK